jgi:hypothetical protein
LLAGFVVAFAAIVVVPGVVKSPAPVQAGKVVAIAVACGLLLGVLSIGLWVWSSRYRDFDAGFARQARRSGFAFAAAGSGFLVIALTRRLDTSARLFLCAMLLGFMPIVFFVDPMVRRRLGKKTDAGT